MMKKLFLLCIICGLSIVALAQADIQTKIVDTRAVTLVQPFGKIDKSDLEMKACNFEPDANAEILFDKGSVSFFGYNLVFERHVRIKIFNDKGRNEAEVKLAYFDQNNMQRISDLKAETINLSNDNIEYTPVDKKTIFKQRVDKYRSALAFTFPNVQAGSVIEFSFHMESFLEVDFPGWYFQTTIPTRYSEIKTDLPSVFHYQILELNNKDYFINSPNKKAMINVPSISNEPFMTSRADNLQKILYKFSAINAPGIQKNFSSTWERVGQLKMDAIDFGAQLDHSIEGQREIIKKAKTIISVNDRVEYLFNLVKNSMKWNGINATYTDDGTEEAWKKKTGNATEINLILCHLLKESDVKAYPMLASTRENGKIIPGYPNENLFNRAVVYIPQSNDFFVLDASNKYNLYNEVPETLLNNMAFYIDNEDNKYDLIFLQRLLPVNQTITVNADVRPNGVLSGSVRISNFSYNRINSVQKYKTGGEQKYIDYLVDKNNSLSISALKFDNLEIDSLPLVQHFDFNLQLEGSDNTYIYVNANFLPMLKTNPFIKDSRSTNIDFGYCNNYLVNNIYKLPAGYKIDALPKSATMSMPDTSVTFKRIVSEDEGTLTVRYFIVYKKSFYFKEDYPQLRDFYKKMYEMLNEQIVLKKD